MADQERYNRILEVLRKPRTQEEKQEAYERFLVRQRERDAKFAAEMEAMRPKKEFYERYYDL